MLNKKVLMAEFSDVRYDARVLKEAQALAKKGLHVDLLMYNEAIKSNRIRFEDGVIYHEYAFPNRNRNHSFLDRIYRLIAAFWILIRINSYILLHYAHIYHAHNLYFLLTAVIRAKLCGSKLVYDAHELHCEHYEPSSLKGNLLNKLSEMYEHTLVNKCDAFIQASEERAEFIKQRYKIPSPYVIHNYVPLVPYPKPSDIFIKSCNILPGTPTLFYSGGIYMGGNRRIDKVIEALTFLDGIHLVLIGFMNDSIRYKLESLAKKFNVIERIHLLPSCSPQEIILYAASADVGIIPLYGNSINTKLSALNKISEYLMAGLPLACSSYQNLRNIVYHNPIGITGETFNVLSPLSISQAVNKIMKNKEKIPYRKNALFLAHSYMNWQSEEKILYKIYNTL